MPSIISSGLGLYYVSDNKEYRCLIDLTDKLSNLGAVPLSSMREDSRYTVPGILHDVYLDYQEVAKAVGKTPDPLWVTIAMIFVFRQSFLGYRPLKVLEVGCNNGLLTYLLVRIARAAHPESHVWTLAEDSFDESFISTIRNLGDDAVSNLCLLPMNPESDMINSDYFDLTIINGEYFFENISEVMLNAFRVTRPGGHLLSHTNGNRWLRSCFYSLPSECEEYLITKNNSVLVKIIPESKQNAVPMPHAQERLTELHAKLKLLLHGDDALLEDKLRTAIEILTEMERHAIASFSILNIDRKQLINEAKENALNCLYAKNDTLRHKCEAKLKLFTHEVL